MRDTASRSTKSRRRSLWIAAGAVPTAIALSLSLASPVAMAQSSVGSSGVSPELIDSITRGMTDYLQPRDEALPEGEVTYPAIQGLPEGVRVNSAEYVTSHHVVLSIQSAAMPERPIKVQLLLPRDWYSTPDRTYPEI